EDWDFLFGLGQGIAAESAGKLLGTALFWTYEPNASALGLVGVAPEAQGRGLGRRLVEQVLRNLRGRSIVLYATEHGVRLYESFGFVTQGLIRQHQGTAFQPALVPPRPGERLRPIGRSDPPLLAKLDQEANGMDRAALITALIAAGNSIVLDRDGSAIGFAVLRRFGIGHMIGPVIAPDETRARVLIGHFLASHPGQFLRVDVPAPGTLSPWLQSLGLADAGPAIRMVRGPVQRGEGSFALVSQAFG
ncbi:MAG TPA: GNAT family N-acetyltransferase, partial [Acetobacteraceae bacterium]